MNTSNAPKVEQTLLFTLPDVPKRQRTKWEELQEMAEIGLKEGGLISGAIAADVLGVTPQRMYQFIDEGRFRVWEFFGKRYIANNDLRVFVDVNRSTGRPAKSLVKT